MSIDDDLTCQASSKGTKEWFQVFDACPHSCCCSVFGPLSKDIPWISTKEGNSIVLFGALKDSSATNQ